MKRQYLVIVAIVILLVIAIIWIIREESSIRIPSGYALLCFSDANLTVETKTDARIVFDWYLKQNYPDIPMPYDVEEEREFFNALLGGFGATYYSILSNCPDIGTADWNKTFTKLKNKTEQRKFFLSMHQKPYCY